MNPQTLAQAVEPFEYHGKTYNLGVADYELELYYQARHEAWVRNRIEATSGMVSADVHRTDVDAFARQRAGNLFAFRSQLSMQWLLSDEGFSEYVALLSGKGKKEQGGALFTRETLRMMRKEDRPEWDRLVKVIVGRDFPNLMGPASSEEQTPPLTTNESSSSSVANPGSWADAKSSAFPTPTSVP